MLLYVHSFQVRFIDYAVPILVNHLKQPHNTYITGFSVPTRCIRVRPHQYSCREMNKAVG